MLGVNLEDVRILREAKEEGRQEGRQEGHQEGRQEILAATIPLLLRAGLTIEQITQQLQLDEAEIQRFCNS